MGVKRLWNYMQGAGVNVGLSEYRGHRIGVDAYSWIYSQLESCFVARASVPDGVVKRARRLRKAGITPVFVFDGADVPVKAEAIEKRRARRLRRALLAVDRFAPSAIALDCQLDDEDARVDDFGEPKRRQQPLPYQPTSASDALLRSARVNFEVTCDHAKTVVDALRASEFECIVAPYEADAQLAYLSGTNYVNHVMTEDSDALVFGCPSVIRGGSGCSKGENWHAMADTATPTAPSYYVAYTHRRVLDVMGCTAEQLVLATAGGGSDYYLRGAVGVALSKSLHLVRGVDSVEMFVDEVAAATAMDGEQCIAFTQQLFRALHCYQHHIVYDPVAKACTTLHALTRSRHRKLLGEILRLLWRRKRILLACCTPRRWRCGCVRTAHCTPARWRRTTPSGSCTRRWGTASRRMLPARVGTRYRH
jgi:exonuclease 1